MKNGRFTMKKKPILLVFRYFSSRTLEKEGSQDSLGGIIVGGGDGCVFGHFIYIYIYIYIVIYI
jgi:hypothetical protein